MAIIANILHVITMPDKTINEYKLIQFTIKVNNIVFRNCLFKTQFTIKNPSTIAKQQINIILFILLIATVYFHPIQYFQQLMLVFA